MDQPAYVPVSVIDSRYMTPHKLNVIVVTNSTGDHLITDAYHNTVMFKIRTLHTRWNAFMGYSKDSLLKIFTVKKANIIESRTNLHVLLANRQRSKEAGQIEIALFYWEILQEKLPKCNRCKWNIEGSIRTNSW